MSSACFARMTRFDTSMQTPAGRRPSKRRDEADHYRTLGSLPPPSPPESRPFGFAARRPGAPVHELFLERGEEALGDGTPPRATRGVLSGMIGRTSRSSQLSLSATQAVVRRADPLRPAAPALPANPDRERAGLQVHPLRALYQRWPALPLLSCSWARGGRTVRPPTGPRRACGGSSARQGHARPRASARPRSRRAAR